MQLVKAWSPLDILKFRCYWRKEVDCWRHGCECHSLFSVLSFCYCLYFLISKRSADSFLDTHFYHGIFSWIAEIYLRSIIIKTGTWLTYHLKTNHNHSDSLGESTQYFSNLLWEEILKSISILKCFEKGIVSAFPATQSFYHLISSALSWNCQNQDVSELYFFKLLKSLVVWPTNDRSKERPVPGKLPQE